MLAKIVFVLLPRRSLANESLTGRTNASNKYITVEFFILGLLIKFSLYEREISSQKAIVFMTIIFGFSLACIDELHQSFIRGRVCSVDDLLFDFLGISLIFFNYKNFF